MNSRSEQKDKLRKINKIYNTSIAVVFVLIVIVSVILFTGNDEKEQTAEKPKQVEKQEETSSIETNQPVETERPELVEPATDEAVSEEESTEASAETEVSEEEQKEEEESTKPKLEKVEGSGDANVANTYTSEGWKSVGTAQAGEHTTNFDKGSTDWNEMEKAIAYGAGIEQGSMRLWWLQNGGSPNTAIGTVSPGDNAKTYRVYIEWVDGEGWKPAKVEELKKNDKAR